eukprot:1161347-Pelagomonas_calceolata.AAC.16
MAEAQLLGHVWHVCSRCVANLHRPWMARVQPVCGQLTQAMCGKHGSTQLPSAAVSSLTASIDGYFNPSHLPSMAVSKLHSFHQRLFRSFTASNGGCSDPCPSGHTYGKHQCTASIPTHSPSSPPRCAPRFPGPLHTPDPTATSIKRCSNLGLHQATKAQGTSSASDPAR